MQQQLKRFIWNWRGVWTVAPTIALFIIALRLLGCFQSWEWAAFDQYLRTRPKEPIDHRIVIVGIDEADLRKVGQWPIPDTVLAQLIEKIKGQNPRAIGLDLYRDLPIEPGHDALVNVFKTTPNLIGIEKINEQDPNAAIAPPPILAQQGQVGLNNVVVDDDGKLRRSLLSGVKNGEPFPSFAFLLAGLYLQPQNILPQPTETDPKIFHWGKGLFRPFTPNDGGYVHADDGGYQLLLNYRGAAQSFRTVSLTQVLEGRIPTDLMHDRIVLIGSTATSLNDFFYTPYSGDRITTLQRTPGIEIHANIISQILSTVLEGCPLIQTWPEPIEGLWILLWSFVGATLTWNWRYISLNPKKTKTKNFPLSPFPFSLSPLLALASLFGITYASFLYGWWIPIVPPLLTFSGSAIAITTYLAYTATQIRQTFGRYLSDSVVAELLENPKGLQLGGENRTLTILTSDLRGFTALSEQLSPQDVVKILNIYLESMTHVITQYQGTIDDFIGDGILVLFGAPIPQENHPDKAVACAVAMQLAMNSVNERIQQLGFPKLAMGIGINTGEVVLGNIGSTQRTKYSAIGQHVNLTFRLESYTVGGQIFVSESTLKQVKQPLTLEGHKQVKPKGIKQALTIYEVRGIGGDYNLFLPQEEEIFFPLPEEIRLEFHYALLDGKHIGDSLFKGNLVKLSANGALVRAENTERYAVPEPLSNIKLTLLSANHCLDTDNEIYAKVLKKAAEPGSFYIHFTAKSPTVAAKLEYLYTRIKS